MKRTTLALLVAGAFCTGAAAAEPLVAAGEPLLVPGEHRLLLADAGDHADAWRRWADDFSREMRSSMGSMFSHRVGSVKAVKGAPYSAEIVTESNQALADGNAISRKSASRVYRDGEGRTRQEGQGAGRDAHVYINDPVARTSLVMSPATKSAWKASGNLPMAMAHEHAMKGATKDLRVFKFGASELRIEDGKVFLDGKDVTDGKVAIDHGGKDVRVEGGKVFVDGKEFAPEGRKRVIVKRSEGADPVDGARREEMRIEIVRSGDGKEFSLAVPPVPPVPPVPGVAPFPPFPPLPGAFPMHHYGAAKLGKGVTTSLGTKDFDGVRADGKSTVWTISAGEIGNRNPILVSSESWYSPELRVTVYSRHNDPRQGETIYRLSGITRAEPAPELFKVPEGYQMKGSAKREPGS